ncbi:MAG: response regulator, partial [Clostridiales bacterium]|nr:response regulator [Clostridiales bacterium]
EGIAACYPWAEMGFEVSGTFPNGKNALDYIERYLVDVVLSDIRMPKMDGLELARAISKGYPNITVVLLSGYAEFEYAQEALRFGVKEYILKPIKYDTIIRVFSKIHENLDSSRGIRKIDEQSPGYYDIIVDQVTRYVEEHYQDANLEDASTLVSLSPNYLSKIFKRKKGKNFSEYVLDVKMEKAAGLLRNITLKTYEVATAVGYDNPKNFSRAFKQYCGKTPKEFREQEYPL